MYVRVFRRAFSLAAGLAVLAGGLVQQAGVQADLTWCWNDPAITVGGQTFTVQLGVQAPAATVIADVERADIVVHVPQGLTSYSVEPYPQTPFPQRVTVVSDNGPYVPSAGAQVAIVATFTLAPGTPALQAAMQVSGPGGTVAQTRSTVQGALVRDLVLPP